MNYLRVKDAAQYLSVGVSTVWLYAKQGKLHPLKLSDRVTVFSKEDLDAFINNAMAA
jgi:excisionase family DNA binding protein